MGLANKKATHLHTATAGAHDVLDISVDLAVSGLLADDLKVGVWWPRESFPNQSIPLTSVGNICLLGRSQEGVALLLQTVCISLQDL